MLLHLWLFPGKNSEVGFHFLLQGIFLTQGSNFGLRHYSHILSYLSHQGSPVVVQFRSVQSLSRVWLFATPWTVAYQTPWSMEFSRQEYWSGWPSPSPGDLPEPRDQIQVSCIAGKFFTIWATIYLQNNKKSFHLFRSSLIFSSQRFDTHFVIFVPQCCFLLFLKTMFVF